MNDVIQVVATASSRDEAEKLARHLVENRLAACVQISSPITSIYRWQGKIETSEEFHCTIKTLRSKYKLVEAAIRELHSYEQPEVLAVPVLDGSEAYTRWVWDEVADAP